MKRGIEMDKKNRTREIAGKIINPIDWRLGEEETVFDNPEKYGFMEVMSQGFYGNNNRTMTVVKKDCIEQFIVNGCELMTDDEYDKIKLTTVKVPNTENIVIIYDATQEEQVREDNNRNHNRKCLVSIDELGLNLYSTCIFCRQNENGEYSSIQSEDFEKYEKYLTA